MTASAYYENVKIKEPVVCLKKPTFVRRNTETALADRKESLHEFRLRLKEHFL